MTFDFYVGNTQYTVEDTNLRKNGEVLIQGKLYIYRLLLGMPGLLMFSESESDSVKLFKTQVITSILPFNEFNKGEQCPNKTLFNIVFSDRSGRLPKKYQCYAVSEEHAEQLFILFNNNEFTKINSITLANREKKQA
ncbi:hypothetical protein [Sutcliffiella cohnii]|uniref:hypothetical protein n=1 Tax=Sutcliffiella cohnii TaxID=33932 RepID=UPI00082A2DF7|nr:hypothetical protein [Sutcliffiella cohnii]